MSEALLQALSTLYHHPDQEAKRRASQWLEEWRLTPEAWNAADSILHSGVKNVEVLFFCSQTLVFKIQQDFEELPKTQVPQLRESLVELMRKFSREEGMELVHKQLGLALAAMTAHVDASLWAPSSCIQWLGDRLGSESDLASVTSLIEILTVLPEEARNRRIGLHPSRRKSYLKELENAFPDIFTLLDKCRMVAPVEDRLKVFGNWLQICSAKLLEKSLTSLGPFVQLAVDSLESPTAFSAAVVCLSELIDVTSCSAEMHQLCDFIATTLVRYQPRLQRRDMELEHLAGMARLFCDIGCHYDHLMLSPTDTSAALIEGVLAITSHPDEEVHDHTFEFWERMTYRVARAMSSDGLTTDRFNYFISVFQRLMSALLELAKLPEDYMEMSEKERRDVHRREIRTAMQDAVEVIGEQRCLHSVVTALPGACQSGDWRQIEALLFALESIAVVSRRVKAEMAVPLFQALGAVPDQRAVQSAMCGCLASYAAWLPIWRDQTGVEPLPTLLPVICKNLTAPEWAAAAVDAMAALCKTCRMDLPAHAAQLLELHNRVTMAANAFHQWTAPVEDFVMKEVEAIDVMGALYQGITRSRDDQVATQFMTTVSEAVLKDLAAAIESSRASLTASEAKLTILVTRLKTLFRNCAIPDLTGQLLGRVCSDLLQLASQASSSASLVESICTCLRYGVKNSGSACEGIVPTLVGALPQLFSVHYQCGYLYVASELTKKFGKTAGCGASVQQLVVELLTIACGALDAPNDFKESPELADDTFLMAGRVLNYCPEALLTHSTLLPLMIDTVAKGALVQHEDAGHSILKFLTDLAATVHHQECVSQALMPRGAFLTRVLMAGVVGALPLRTLEDVSQALRALLRFSDQSLEWISMTFGLLPDGVLSSEEKSAFLNGARSSEVMKSERLFLREIDDLADVCRRSRIVRQAAQTALTPETHL